MKCLAMLSLVLTTTLIVSGCDALATPTCNRVDIKSTVVDGAFTMVAETQASIPTATPLPPTPTITNTSAPTATFLPLPSATWTSVPGGNSSAGDECIHRVLPATL